MWIDHREATIVILTEAGKEIRHILSNNARHIRYSGSCHSKAPQGLKEVTSEEIVERLICEK